MEISWIRTCRASFPGGRTFGLGLANGGRTVNLGPVDGRLELLRGP